MKSIRNMSFDELLEEYKKCVFIHNQIDYLDMKTIRKANRAVDKMTEISKIINNKYNQQIIEFSKLLEISELRTDVWAAHDILQNMDYPLELESKALGVIIQYSKENSPDGLGNRMWLRDWYAGKIEKVKK